MSTTTTQQAPIPDPIEDDDDDYYIPPTPPKHRFGNFTSTSALVTAIFLVAAFWGGAEAQQRWGTSSTSNARSTARGATAAAAAGGATGGFGANRAAGGFGGGAASGRTGRGTTGTVKSVDGNVITMTNAAGNDVKVTTSDSSRVTKSVGASLSDIKPGDNLVVQGTTGADGSVAATQLTVGATGTGAGGGAGAPAGAPPGQ